MKEKVLIGLVLKFSLEQSPIKIRVVDEGLQLQYLLKNNQYPFNVSEVMDVVLTYKLD